MIRNPIYKVLSTFAKYKVKSLLIGGQACILYGAAEFSRDTDLVVLCNLENIESIKKALKELRADRIYVPPLEMKYLLKGHACHFRSYDPGIKGMRIDIMAKMRNCPDFDELWEKRTTVNINKREKIELIGLKDLVSSKKTQRDKDWFMLTRLVDNDILMEEKTDTKKIKWWLLECRTLENLIVISRKYKALAKKCVKDRPLLRYALNGDERKVQSFLNKEELLERNRDRQYWLPLLKELETLRHKQKDS